MSLTLGARLGPYEVTALLGAGGMGEVYRARDTKLNRDVALKVLPAQMAADPERLARLTREAQVLASLNQANIAAIHGLEDTDGVRALVLELVEGPTLADRIALGAVPVDEALFIARQILDALEAAHEHGIVHRDLKPANIKIRDDGTVKVLDFGLAKALDASPATSVAATTMSPTLSMHATQAGLILGTAAYMSPEQAAGRPADKRSDIWAFGVVLLEMLTGGQAFTGETVPHVLASVLKSEPEWARLPSDTPPQVRRLLRLCLEKDRKRRLDSAVAARLEIDDTLSMPDSGRANVPVAARSHVAPIAITAIAVGALMTAVTWALLRPPSSTPRQPSRFLLASSDPLAINQFDRSIALSPDGRSIVYVTPIKGAGTGGGLSVRSLDRLEPLRLPGITGARSPFLSPDSRWIGFFDGTELKKLPMDGGTPISLCTFSGAPRGASWDDDGTVVFATADPLTGLWRVPANGGQPIALTTPVVSKGEGDHWFPSVLPEGRGVLFTLVRPGQQAQQAEVAVFDARTKEYRTLIRGSQPQFVESGHLLYVADGRLWAVRFDLETLQMSGDAVPMADVVRVVLTGAAYYAVSRAGTLLYVTTGPQPQRSLMWVDRRGREEPLKVPPRAYVLPRLSPDGTRVAVDIRDQENDIWIVNVVGDGTPRRLTYGPSFEINPVWVDNNNLAYSSNRSGRFDLYSQAADGSGTATPLTESSGGTRFPTTVALKGAAVVGHQDGPTVYDIALFPAPQSGQPPPPAQTLVKTPSFEFNADLSPNGRYLAYQSNESGPFQIIVRPFPQIEGGKWTISTGGGSSPVWSRDGRELFYHDETDRMVAVPVDTSGPTFTWGLAQRLFDIQASATVPDRGYDVSLDGQRFLFVKEDTSTQTADIVVVLDWLEELKAKVPAAP